MAFTPIALPIQELLLTNFVTDIATITNSNTLLLQAKVEDLINNLEIDTAGLSIGTSNPINYVKANSVVLQDQGFIFQVGLPTPVVKASLAKDGSNNSVLTVDKIISNVSAQFNAITLNSLTINSGGSTTISSPSTFGANVTVNNSFCESKETVIVDLKANVGATSANAILTLSSTSRQNIFITLKAAISGADQVYDSGSASILSSINDLNIIINFDSVSPPAQNTVFTIHIVDVVESSLSGSIVTAVQLKNCPFYIKAGTNNNTTSPIILHDNTSKIGMPLSNTFKKYGTNVSFVYIIDSTSSDRLIAKSLVGASLF
jgi:hypothetical protein